MAQSHPMSFTKVTFSPGSFGKIIHKKYVAGYLTSCHASSSKYPDRKVTRTYQHFIAQTDASNAGEKKEWLTKRGKSEIKSAMTLRICHLNSF
jgi:hypothetical protein